VVVCRLVLVVVESNELRVEVVIEVVVFGLLVTVLKLVLEELNINCCRDIIKLESDYSSVV